MRNSNKAFGNKTNKSKLNKRDNMEEEEDEGETEYWKTTRSKLKIRESGGEIIRGR